MSQVTIDMLLGLRSEERKLHGYHWQYKRHRVQVYYSLLELQKVFDGVARTLGASLELDESSTLSALCGKAVSCKKYCDLLLREHRELVVPSNIEVATLFGPKGKVRFSRRGPFIPRLPGKRVSHEGVDISHPFLMPNKLATHLADGWDYGIVEFGDKFFYFGEIYSIGHIPYGIIRIPPGISKRKFFDKFIESIERYLISNAIGNDVIQFQFYCYEGRWYLEGFFRTKYYQFRCLLVDLETESKEACKESVRYRFERIAAQLRFLNEGSSQINKSQTPRKIMGRISWLGEYSEVLAEIPDDQEHEYAYEGLRKMLHKSLGEWRRTLNKKYMLVARG